jgi:hypothetical protein
MNPRTSLSVLRWLIRDTFRQARSSGAFWLMLGVTLACVALCLTVNVADGSEDPSRAVRTLEMYLAGWVADAIGLLLTLMWTASFLPSFLEASTASVLLAKPVSRGSLLVGKCLGVLAFVAVQDSLFVGGTWLALGLRTGVWDKTYLLCLPLLLLHFAVFFSFSALLAVATRSTISCVFGSILFWLVCWAMNVGRHSLLLLPDVQAATAGLGHTVEFGYWLLPKPLDCHLILLGTLQDDYALSHFLDPRALTERGAWQPVASVLASCACALVLLALAAYDFVTAEY